MKKYWLLLCMLLFSGNLLSQDISGTWEEKGNYSRKYYLYIIHTSDTTYEVQKITKQIILF